jgi:hypothetical protein
MNVIKKACTFQNAVEQLVVRGVTGNASRVFKTGLTNRRQKDRNRSRTERLKIAKLDFNVMIPRRIPHTVEKCDRSFRVVNQRETGRRSNFDRRENVLPPDRSQCGLARLLPIPLPLLPNGNLVPLAFI